jgi:hypothetical protein
MQYFLEFDPESFLTIVKKLFVDKEPFEFIQTSVEFLEDNREANPLLKSCANHSEILMCFAKVVSTVIENELK